MSRLIKTVLLGSLFAVCFVLADPAPQQAEAQRHRRYWNRYWNWYDSTYRPYYQSRYRYRDRYGYDWDDWDDRRYRRYGSYYRYPGRSYYGSRYPRGAVQIGPLRIERWY